MTWNPPQTAPAMGWYPLPNGDLRWWDGRRWTGMRVRGGAPGIDWATTEQPGLALAFSLIFLSLALLQTLLYLVAPGGGFLWLPLVMFANAALWLAIAVQGFSLRRMPPPSAAPVAPDAIRPLPWEAEAPGFGWYPISPLVSRWWTGARWAQYTASRFGVRPTFHGARSYRVYLATMWVLVGIGAAAVVAGIAVCALGDDQIWMFVGGFVIGGGAFIALIGALFLALSGRQRRVLLPPEQPPAAPAAFPR